MEDLLTQFFKALLTERFLVAAVLTAVVVGEAMIIRTLWKALQEQARVSAELSAKHVTALNNAALVIENFKAFVEGRFKK